MAFDKTYPNRKDWRRQYFGRRRFASASCRPNGSCSWCESSRTHQWAKQRLRAHDEDFQDGRQVRPRRKVR